MDFNIFIVQDAAIPVTSVLRPYAPRGRPEKSPARKKTGTPATNRRQVHAKALSATATLHSIAGIDE
jgi:hypothetical protein